MLADRYQGKRLNSPNDLVYRSDGTLYFTDPPFGLPKAFDDPTKELPFSGVYMVKDGQVTLLTKELSGPNGIAFSPDEKYLYVDNWDLKRKVLMRYEVQPDGTHREREGRSTTSPATREPVALDGIKVDQQGNVYVSAPGGVWILSPEGKALGRIVPPEHDANFAFGDADGKTLYLTASTGLYRIRTGRPGDSPADEPAGRGPLIRAATRERNVHRRNVTAVCALVLALRVGSAQGQLHPKPSRDPIITRLDARVDALVPPGARLEKIADDHGWAEGPVWVRDGGYLLFSDVVKNTIYRWKDGEGERVLPAAERICRRAAVRGPGARAPTGWRSIPTAGWCSASTGSGASCAARPTAASRFWPIGIGGGVSTVPNDLVFRSNGDLYFTDPPFGLPGSYADPGKELAYQGVYRLTSDGALTLLASELSGPNGIAFSPTSAPCTSPMPTLSGWRGWPTR